MKYKIRYQCINNYFPGYNDCKKKRTINIEEIKKIMQKDDSLPNQWLPCNGSINDSADPRDIFEFPSITRQF